MGGEREDVIESESQQAGEKSSAATTIKPKDGKKKGSHFRFHESKGEVHFHDDSEGLKVAIPVPVWGRAWDKLAQPMGKKGEKFRYVDRVNHTVLTVKTSLVMDEKAGGIVTADMQIAPHIQDNPTFAKLLKFTRP